MILAKETLITNIYTDSEISRLFDNAKGNSQTRKIVNNNVRV